MQSVKINQRYRDLLYPAHLFRIMISNQGSKVLLRPIKISDAELLVDMFKSLSQYSKYMRFLTVKKELPMEEALTFATVDYDRNFAVVAVPLELEKETIIGVARYNATKSKKKAEI